MKNKCNKKLVCAFSICLILALGFLISGSFCIAYKPFNPVGPVLLSTTVVPATFVGYALFNIKDFKIIIYNPIQTKINKSEKEFGDEYDLFPKRKAIADGILKEIAKSLKKNDVNRKYFAIYGEYGSGKSDFIERFVGYNPKQSKIHKVIFNASLFDEFNDATSSLIRLLISNKLLTDDSILKIMKVESELNSHPLKINKSIIHKKFEEIDFLEEVKVILGDDEKLKNDELIIIIDELDRTSPEFTLNLLKSTKHYFSHIQKINFIFSISLEPFNKILENYYGISQSREFLEKYVSHSFDLNCMNFNDFFEKKASDKIDEIKMKTIQTNMPQIVFKNLRRCETLLDLIETHHERFFNNQGKLNDFLFHLCLSSWVEKIQNKSNSILENKVHTLLLNEESLLIMKTEIKNYSFDNLHDYILENIPKNEFLENIKLFIQKNKKLKINGGKDYYYFVKEFDELKLKAGDKYSSIKLLKDDIDYGSASFHTLEEIFELVDIDLIAIRKKEINRIHSSLWRRMNIQEWDYTINNKHRNFLEDYIKKIIKETEEWT